MSSAVPGTRVPLTFPGGKKTLKRVLIRGLISKNLGLRGFADQKSWIAGSWSSLPVAAAAAAAAAATATAAVEEKRKSPKSPIQRIASKY